MSREYSWEELELPCHVMIVKHIAPAKIGSFWVPPETLKSQPIYEVVKVGTWKIKDKKLLRQALDVITDPDDPGKKPSEVIARLIKLGHYKHVDDPDEAMLNYKRLAESVHVLLAGTFRGLDPLEDDFKPGDKILAYGGEPILYKDKPHYLMQRGGVFGRGKLTAGGYSDESEAAAEHADAMRAGLNNLGHESAAPNSGSG